jgi:SAM-dependent methyltransferase
MTLREIFWQSIPATRVGVFSGRIKCPCEVQFWNMLEKFFQDGSEKTLVDLGCGPGIKSLTLALTGAQVIGFDTRESSIRHAQENTRQIQAQYPQKTFRSQFFCKDIEQGIPEISDSSVDFVLFVEVIEHLVHYHDVLTEIRRILKPDGRVFITTPNKTFHHKDHDEHVYGEKAYGHVREFDLEELVIAVEQAGLAILYKGYVNTRTSTFLCRWIHPWMIRDHGFLQRKEHIDDVIGIRTLGFLQPLYNRCFFLISAIIAGYNRWIFPLLNRLVTPTTEITHGKTVFVVGTKT